MALITEDGRRVTASGRIFIRPSIPEWLEEGDNYEDLIEALGEQGIEVELAEMKGIPSGADLAAHFIPEALAIYVGMKATDALIESIVAEVTRKIVNRAKTRWWHRGEEVKGTIYGPDGEVLKEVIWRSTEGRVQGDLVDPERQPPPR